MEGPQVMRSAHNIILEKNRYYFGIWKKLTESLLGLRCQHLFIGAWQFFFARLRGFITPVMKNIHWEKIFLNSIKFFSKCYSNIFLK